MTKYLKFDSHKAAFAFSHQVAVERGHHHETKDVFWPVVKTPFNDENPDTGAYLVVEPGTEEFLTKEQQGNLIEAKPEDVEDGGNFPETSINVGGTATKPEVKKEDEYTTTSAASDVYVGSSDEDSDYVGATSPSTAP
jgi:hypothetical protein